ncbi:hypothetical protein FA15DRAFT_703863 [Coprinopsis marcescibilis]|uniref:Uncharacterized protein n=1 Tax=Coprinopsis marcescibilis TaxID=230819 RepID=A0A5C3LAM9_COPMA|nr:hypothetical protein FA15DRAFT_703863 [Coprinopsis marcescibilis]
MPHDLHDNQQLSKQSYTVQYKNEDVKFNVWTRPIWAWVKELLQDRATISQFEWNAQQVYRKNSDGTTTRMFTEPWTADSWWETQSKLPKGGVPFCIILYADKTRLSSFGTKKGYPVYVQCGNLPAEVWNGKGIAGGQLVGWLPVVPEDADKMGTQWFADFKRVVWHEGFENILESIVEYSKTGYFFQCGDHVKCRVFPIVMILSADYEEQCVMATIRGTNSKCPCPICLVPGSELNELSKMYPLRTTEEIKMVYEEVQTCRTLKAKNEILIKVGLQDIENVFWKIGYTNVYEIILWDRLHAYHLGLFGDHLLAGIEIDGATHLFAIVVPCDENPATIDSTADRILDKHLQLTRVRMWRGQNMATAMSIHAIVWGAVLVQDPTCPYNDEYVVMDVLNPDFWLCHKKLVLQKKLRFTRLPI